MRTFFFICFLLIRLLVCGQIPENGFENWSPSATGNFEEPSGAWWTTLNSLKNLGGPVTVTKTSDAYSGNYAARLETKQWGTFLLSGLLVSGVFVNNSPFIIQGKPFQGRPTRFRGYYKYISVNSDSAAIFAMLTKFNSATGKRDTLADVRFAVLNSTSDYVLFDIPFHYYFSDIDSDSIDIVFSSSAGGNDFKGQVGSTLWVDEIMLEFPNGVNTFLLDVFSMSLYPNPVSEILSVDFKGEIDDNMIVINSMDGKVVKRICVEKNKFDIHVKDLLSGYYTVNLFHLGYLIDSKKIEIIH